MLAADAVYDKKATHRQMQGVGEIIDAWQRWAKTIPNTKATFVREFASGDTLSSRLCGRAFTPDRYRHQRVIYRH